MEVLLLFLVGNRTSDLEGLSGSADQCNIFLDYIIKKASQHYKNVSNAWFALAFLQRTHCVAYLLYFVSDFQ